MRKNIIFKALLISIILMINQAYGASTSSILTEPVNISWLIEGELCSIESPKNPRQLLWLIQHNIGHMIIITKQENSLHCFLEYRPIKGHIVFIEKYKDLTFEQIDSIIEEINRTIKTGKAVALNWINEARQAGTLYACWLIVQKNMGSDSAIQQAQIQRTIPEEQQYFIAEYSIHHRNMVTNKSKKLTIS